MPYLGQHMVQCSRVPFNFRMVEVFIVNGVKLNGHPVNPCGHAILRAGHYYFHIDGPVEHPWYLDEAGFKRYLNENDKTVERRILAVLPNPDGARRKMDQLMANDWRWWGVLHNCATFVEEILAAGGWPHLRSYGNCPKLGWR